MADYMANWSPWLGMGIMWLGGVLLGWSLGNVGCLSKRNEALKFAQELNGAQEILIEAKDSEIAAQKEWLEAEQTLGAKLRERAELLERRSAAQEETIGYYKEMIILLKGELGHGDK